MTWLAVCAAAAVPAEQGVAALLPDGRQVAVFRTHDGTLHALSNMDPFAAAPVLARGIVGDLGGVAVVASPMHKQHFELATGRCVEHPDVVVPVFAVRQLGDRIMVTSG